MRSSWRHTLLLPLVVLTVSGCSLVGLGTGWLLETPQLISPPNGATLPCGGTFVFSWGPVTNASQYVIEVYNAASGALAASAQTDADTQTATLVLACATPYRWRVAAAATNGGRQWSASWTFTVQ